MIRIEDYVTSNDKYPERAQSPELTEKVLENAEELLERVNDLLIEIDATGETPKVNSGFRPASVNATVVGAAKKSTHITGEGIDLGDKNNRLGKMITVKLLEKFDLYMENPSATNDWLHLQSRRVGSGNRIFNP